MLPNLFYGNSNIDKKTGIHYGAISQYHVDQDIWESFESIYPDDDDEFSDSEPIGQEWTGEKEYNVEYSDSLNCFVVLKSPYFTWADPCSPCLPNAGDLDTTYETLEQGKRLGLKTYCLGHDFFADQGGAPYPVYRVRGGKEVFFKTYEQLCDERAQAFQPPHFDDFKFSHYCGTPEEGQKYCVLCYRNNSEDISVFVKLNRKGVIVGKRELYVHDDKFFLTNRK